MEVKLGNKVKDRVTGFTGIVTGISRYLHGCDRALVESSEIVDGKYLDMAFDVTRLEVIENTSAEDFTNKVEEKKGKTGGPQKSIPGRRRI